VKVRNLKTLKNNLNEEYLLYGDDDEWWETQTKSIKIKLRTNTTE